MFIVAVTFMYAFSHFNKSYFLPAGQPGGHWSCAGCYQGQGHTAAGQSEGDSLSGEDGAASWLHGTDYIHYFIGFLN